MEKKTIFTMKFLCFIHSFSIAIIYLCTYSETTCQPIFIFARFYTTIPFWRTLAGFRSQFLRSKFGQQPAGDRPQYRWIISLGFGRLCRSRFDRNTTNAKYILSACIDVFVVSWQFQISFLLKACCIFVCQRYIFYDKMKLDIAFHS